MTRLEPTRDRAQATRFPKEREAALRKQLRGWMDYFEAVDNKGFGIIIAFVPDVDDFWSGPWYVREVAE